jgi:hypothetical protein
MYQRVYRRKKVDYDVARATVTVFTVTICSLVTICYQPAVNYDKKIH